MIGSFFGCSYQFNGMKIHLGTALRLHFFNWDSIHARLNSHCKAWNYKKKKNKKTEASRKSLSKEPTINWCMLIPDLKPFTS